jgi:hypothetical protein
MPLYKGWSIDRKKRKGVMAENFNEFVSKGKINREKVVFPSRFGGGAFDSIFMSCIPGSLQSFA